MGSHETIPGVNRVTRPHEKTPIHSVSDNPHTHLPCLNDNSSTQTRLSDVNLEESVKQCCVFKRHPPTHLGIIHQLHNDTPHLDIDRRYTPPLLTTSSLSLHFSEPCQSVSYLQSQRGLLSESINNARVARCCSF